MVLVMEMVLVMDMVLVLDMDMGCRYHLQDVYDDLHFGAPTHTIAHNENCFDVRDIKRFLKESSSTNLIVRLMKQCVLTRPYIGDGLCNLGHTETVLEVDS